MNSEPTKPFKLCFNNEIHRISKVPADFSALIQNVFIAFKNTIPSSWALKYEDADGDLVMLCNDDDYKAMLECELDSPSKSLKIFLLPLEEGAPGNLAKTNSAFGGIPMAESTFFLGNPSQELHVPEVPQQKVIQEEVRVVEKESQYERIEGVNIDNKEEYYAPIVQEPAQVEPEKPEEPKEEVHEELVEPKVEEEENVEEQKQQEEALPPKAEEEDMDTVPDLEENNETSSAQMDDAVDTHDDGFASEEKPEDGVFKKRAAGELASKDQIRFNLRSSALKESKKEKMRGLVTDILFEHVPVLAELIREYLNDPSAFNLEELRKNMKPREEDKTVHKGISCDGCGTKPIIGVRYKCSVCNDFDYCAKCESSVEHPHPFLKIKGTTVNTKVNDASEGHQKRRNSKRLRKPSVEKIVEPPKEEKEEEKIEEHKPEQKEEIVEEVKIEEPEPIKEEPPVEKPVEKPVPQIEEVKIEKIEEKIEKKEVSPIGVSLVKEVCTVPGKITVNDKVIYKTVMLKNTGKVEWPSNLVLRNVGGVSGQDVKMVQLVSGKDFSCILILDNPSQEGEYTSTWQLSYLDQNKDVQFGGEPFTVDFKVHGDGLSQSQIKKQEVEEVKKEEVVEPKKEEPKKEEVVEPPKKKYADSVRETARKVKELFADRDIDELCEFVLKNPGLSDDELMLRFMDA